MNIKEFISAIQKRPKMYVEEVRLDYIYYLVIGYLGSNLINESGCSIDRKFKAHFSNWVLEWVRKNVDESYERKSFFWYQILNDVTSNENEATDLFFKLSNIFFQEVDLKE